MPCCEATYKAAAEEVKKSAECIARSAVKEEGMCRGTLVAEGTSLLHHLRIVLEQNNIEFSEILAKSQSPHRMLV